jgi:hypothetical protein
VSEESAVSVLTTNGTGFDNGAGALCRASEKLPELVAVNRGVAQDPGERAALEFTM